MGVHAGFPGTMAVMEAAEKIAMSLRTEPRIGCVRYLNSKPLIHGHDGEVSFETPASLADGLHAGRLDVALSPIFELLAHPGYLVVDDVAIACEGPVYSVFIVYRGSLAELRTLYLDRDSRTSYHLQRVLLAEFHGLMPRCEPFPDAGLPAELQPGEGALIIGDPAIEFRLMHGERYGYLDLGTAWREATGLPFVFAAWLVRPGTPQPEILADRLRAWRAAGQNHVEDIVAIERRYPRELTRRYLTEHIRFRLGAAEKQAIREFAQLLHKYHMIPGTGGFREPIWI